MNNDSSERVFMAGVVERNVRVLLERQRAEQGAGPAPNLARRPDHRFLPKHVVCLPLHFDLRGMDCVQSAGDAVAEV
jgi:hypothetical protein